MRVAIAAIIAAVLLYLMAWPVPIEPLEWQAPADPGLVDPFAPNDRLSPARAIELGDFRGPEDVAGGRDGLLYASVAGGRIVRFGPTGRSPAVFAETGGRPLGIEFDRDGNLIVANAELGLQRIASDGGVETLVDAVGGRKLVFTNDVAVAHDGRIFFSESSDGFPAAIHGGPYEASLLDILEHGGRGRVFVYDPSTRSVEVLMQGLDFANGVALSADQSFLLIAETGHYRIWKLWLEGPKAGSSKLLLENLPGFPDNINRGLNNRFWIGLVAPRNALVDRLSAWPRTRKVLLRLPRALRPEAEPSSHVIAVDADGQVLMNLQDTAARFPALTGVYETRRALYLSSLFGSRLPMLDKDALAR